MAETGAQVLRDAETALAAVRQLHRKRYGWSFCAECSKPWPCATERAITAALVAPETT